jgi:hypothetical protein
MGLADAGETCIKECVYKSALSLTDKIPRVGKFAVCGNDRHFELIGLPSSDSFILRFRNIMNIE